MTVQERKIKTIGGLMAEVTLARLLKIKSRFTNEYKTQIAILIRENSKLITSTSKVDVAEVFSNVKDIIGRIITAKSLISQANFDIFAQIYEMQEARGLLAQIKSLPTRDGESIQRDTYGRGEPLKETWVAYLKQESIDTIEKEATKKIAQLQDVIDTYNAKKFVTIPDEWL
jgi:hypothetical protein